MRKFLSWGLLIIALGAAWYQWHAHKGQYLAAAHIMRARMFPCSSPITYSIGAMDPRYPLSRDEFAADLREAQAAWDNTARSRLFELTPDSGAVTINLIYDDRQAALDKLKELGIQTDQSLGSYKELKFRYDALLAQVDEEDARLKGVVARYKERESAYNSEVRRLNEKGTATPAQARRVNNAREALSTQFGGIKMIETAVNTDVDTLNALGTTLNQLIVQLDINVAQYNRAGSAIGRYEEGLYKVSNGLQSIDIYKYTDRPQLVNLLAHELGHALGLEHVAGTDSLMYPVNNGRYLKLTDNDIRELNRVCRR